MGSIQQILKSIRIIYFALLIGTISFFAAVLFLKYSGNTSVREIDLMTFQVFQLIAFIFGVGGIAGGIFIFNKKIRSITTDDVIGKLEIYRSAMIIRAATIEGACFMFIIGYFLFQVDFFIIATLIGLGIMVFYFPTTARIAKELKITEKELK
jgi:hypothetical protein